MKSYTDLSFACLNLVDALYKNEDPAPAVQLLSEVCRRDPNVSACLAKLPRTPLPNFHDTSALYAHIQAAISGSSIEDNPNYLMLNLFTADNAAQLLAHFPNKMLLSRGILNFARSLKDELTSITV